MLTFNSVLMYSGCAVNRLSNYAEIRLERLEKANVWSINV